ncbi:Polymeric immunoglobulin receptor [Myotis brandtii]|nr:Polymeric immunoglobulin receptor [Myotis brandtii]
MWKEKEFLERPPQKKKEKKIKKEKKRKKKKRAQEGWEGSLYKSPCSPGENRILEQAEGEGEGEEDKIANGGWSFPSPTSELTATTEDTVETQEPKKAKRSSKEEADMAHTAFLLQANNMATNVQDGPSEA